MLRSTSIYKPPVSDRNDQDKWRYDEDSEAALLGSEFAFAVASLASGNYEAVKPKKKAVPTKKVFWDEKKYNPPLANTHISYEFDAHIKPTERYWSRCGSKFTNDLKLAKHVHDAALMGPVKPVEFPHCFERPITVQERKGIIRPFSRSHKYTKPIERQVPSKKVSLFIRLIVVRLSFLGQCQMIDLSSIGIRTNSSSN